MTYEDLDTFPGTEDIASASVIRLKLNIPNDEILELKEGSMWFRWCNKEKLDTVPAIVISIGGSGAAILSKTFAETLANEYGGPVLIYDRFNMGLSDNTTTTTGTKNGMDLWLSQLDQMFDSDIVGLKGKKFHMMSFSMSTVTQFQYALKHPDRLVSVIFLSGILGSIGDPEGFKKKMGAFNNNNDDKNGQHAMMMKFVVPALYQRAAGQVEEGGDSDGLPVVRAMCRTKGFTEAFLAQMTDPTIMETSMKGANEKSCRELASTKIPIYVRNYEDDSDVNLEGWSKIWKIFKEEGNDALSEYETKSGKHHMYYADDSAKKIASFAQMANKY